LRSNEARKYVKRTWPDIKIPDKFCVVTDTGTLLLSDMADKYLRRLNREDIKNNWKDIAKLGNITKKEKKDECEKKTSTTGFENMDKR
jgi:hypothetical protein